MKDLKQLVNAEKISNKGFNELEAARNIGIGVKNKPIEKPKKGTKVFSRNNRHTQNRRNES